ncbi:hypothetical protein, partial [Enterococcus casseliflavus]|uniref:hypothetical protein n=1 Tax=Enterococcus casseliflavus TaxID=37734 RepID=UPI003D0BD0A1
ESQAEVEQSVAVTGKKHPPELQIESEKHPPELQDLTLYVAVLAFHMRCIPQMCGFEQIAVGSEHY